MTRVVAIAAALAMITLSLFLRSQLFDDDGASNRGSTNGQVTLACISELATACTALAESDDSVQVLVESAGTTMTELAAGQADIDGWLTLEPWPQIADLKAQHSTTSHLTTIASSQLRVAVVAERSGALTSACQGTVGWRCLGDVINQQWSEIGGRPEWGPVKVGLPPPATGTGLVLYANAVSGYFGRSDFATNDFDAGFQTWASGLKSAYTDSPLSKFVQQFPAAFSAVGATDAELRTRLGARQDQVSVTTPEPSARATIVLASVNQDVSELADRRALIEGLRQLGWTEDPVPGDETGLPSAGVLLALSGL